MSALAERQRPAAGESEAARLYEGHADRIFGYCLRRSRSRSDAEDAVQTTFLYALRALRRGVVPECESAWLTTIAKNVCRSQHRALDRRGTLAAEVDLESLTGVERAVGEDEELCRALKAALSSMPESQRRAIVLSEWHGLSSGEVAAQLRMSTPATYALLTRARRSLARALTTPRQAALGLASLVYELRRTIKGLLGGAGAAAKTVAATTLVASVAVGGVSAARAVDGGRGSSQTPEPGGVDVGAAHPQLGGSGSGSVQTSAPRVAAQSPAAGDSGALAEESPTPTSPSTDGATPSQGDESVEQTGSALDTVADLLPEPPPLPGLLPEPPPLPVPPLPTEDLVPPAPELPLDPTVATDTTAPVVESVPTVDLPDLPPLP